MKIGIAVIMLIMSSSYLAIGQSLRLVFGDSLTGEKGKMTYVLPDKSMWIIGLTDAGPLGGSDIIVSKRDSLGNELATLSHFGTADYDYPNNMLALNGQLILAGEVYRANGGDGTITILDGSGRLVSANQYGLPGQTEQFYDIKATADGGFIVTGFGNTPTSNSNDILVSKFDRLYQQEWMKTYDFGRNEVGVAIVERPTGGYFVAADQAQAGGNYNVLILALDSLGNEEWDSTVINPNNGGCKQMKLYQDQIVIVGEMSTSTSSAFDPYMIRLNLAGQVQWEGTLPQSNEGDAIFDLAIQDANTYIMTGYIYNTTTTNTDMMLMIVDSVGQVLSTQYYGGNSFDMGYDVQLLADGEVVLTGFTSEPNGNQVLVIRERLSNLLAAPQQKQAPTQSLVIAPNPATDWVQLMDLPQEGDYEGRIYNSLGQLTWKGELANSHQLNIQFLSTGYYHLQLSNKTTTWATVFYKK